MKALPRSKRRIAVVFFALALGMLSLTATALADNVQNDVVAGGNDTITAGGSTTINYKIGSNNGDGYDGCNAEDGTPAILTVNAPPDVTATPSSRTFTSCKSNQSVVFSSSKPGSYEITVSVSDSGTGTYNTNPAKFTLTVNAGSTAADTTAPGITITTPSDDAVYTLNQSVEADYGCVDPVVAGAVTSGVKTCTGPVANGSLIDTASVGGKAFKVDAEDNAGNTSSLTHDYSVVYDFSGFFRPVDNGGVLNSAKAGSAIPVKFSLAGDQGLSIMDAGFPESGVITCNTSAPVDGLEQTVSAGGSSLSYDATADQYVYVWKTDKGWANTCRQLTVKLNDGTVHTAKFKLTK